MITSLLAVTNIRLITNDRATTQRTAIALYSVFFHSESLIEERWKIGQKKAKPHCYLVAKWLHQHQWQSLHIQNAAVACSNLLSDAKVGAIGLQSYGRQPYPISLYAVVITLGVSKQLCTHQLSAVVSSRPLQWRGSRGTSLSWRTTLQSLLSSMLVGVVPVRWFTE